MSISLSLCLDPSISMFSISVYLSLCPSRSLCPSASIRLCLYPSLSLSVPLYVYLYLSLYVSFSVSLSFSLSITNIQTHDFDLYIVNFVCIVIMLPQLTLQFLFFDQLPTTLITFRICGFYHERDQYFTECFCLR